MRSFAVVVGGCRTTLAAAGLSAIKTQPTPTQTSTDRDFTGQPQNRAVGLLYYQARWYVPGIGRFASADTLVPDPANPQQFNRYSYVLNNALRYTDPTGHSCYNPSLGSPCVLSDGTGNSSSGPSSSPSLPPAVLQQPSPVFLGLPVASEAITWANGFGANSFAADRADPGSSNYNGLYTGSGGLHPGLDFGAIAGTSVYSNVHGIVQASDLYPGDAGAPVIEGKPSNVVVLLDNGMFVIFGHVVGSAELAPGMEVHPGQLVGVVADQGSNSHVHLALRQPTPLGERTYNPANYFVDPTVLSGLPWSDYVAGENLYSISSFLYQPRNNPKNYWVDGALAVGVIR